MTATPTPSMPPPTKWGFGSRASSVRVNPTSSKSSPTSWKTGLPGMARGVPKKRWNSSTKSALLIRCYGLTLLGRCRYRPMSFSSISTPRLMPPAKIRRTASLRSSKRSLTNTSATLAPYPPLPSLSARWMPATSIRDSSGLLRSLAAKPGKTVAMPGYSTRKISFKR